MDSEPSGLEKADINFDGKVQLVGYQISRRPMKPGGPVSLTMYLKVLAKVEPGYRLTTKLLDDAGERLLDLDHAGVLREEKDGKPTMAPETWQVGKVYVDHVKFAMPRNVKTAKVQIVTGFVKGEEKLKVTSGAAVDGLALVHTADVPVRSAKRSRSAELPTLRLDQVDAKTKIKLDGKLDDEAWKAAPATPVATQTGRRKGSISGGTMRMLWNKEGFYFAAEVLDNDVVGGFAKDAKDPQLWTKDSVVLMIDPDGDNKDYYDIQFGPQNLVFDTVYDEQNKPSTEPDGPFGHQEWSSNAKSAVTVQGTLDKSDDEDQGFTVEAFIPWKSFDKAKQVPPTVGDNWRLNVYLIGDRKALSWTPVPGGNFHDTSSYGKILWATKDWVDPATAPAPSAAPGEAAPGELAKAPAASAAPGTPEAPGAKKALPKGIAERVQAAKPGPATPAAPAAAPAAPAPAAPAAPAPGK